MLNRSTLKLVRSLKDKKQRYAEKLFIAEGSKSVLELLRSNLVLQEIFATREWLQEHGQMLTSACTEVSEKEMSQLSLLVKNQGVMAVFAMPVNKFDPAQLAGKLTLALDTVQDPGNLGTIIRIADWYGISDIVCSTACADAFNPKTVQASMASVARVKVHYMELPAFFDSHKIPVYAAVMDGKSIFETQFSKEAVLLIGNEGNGLSDEVIRFDAERISIPRFGQAESLNAAVATAVICNQYRFSAPV